ncbi:hypothetical protein CRI70_16395 [Streptomyces sp. Ru87]|nr:hypothetical protein CRI70_16395 [Streptomyces sp. Ru87]
MTTTQLRPAARRENAAAAPPADGDGESSSGETPLYRALAERWSAAGRAVPGAADEEWSTLVRRPPWPDPEPGSGRRDRPHGASEPRAAARGGPSA